MLSALAMSLSVSNMSLSRIMVAHVQYFTLRVFSSSSLFDQKSYSKYSFYGVYTSNLMSSSPLCRLKAGGERFMIATSSFYSYPPTQACFGTSQSLCSSLFYLRLVDCEILILTVYLACSQSFSQPCKKFSISLSTLYLSALKSAILNISSGSNSFSEMDLLCLVLEFDPSCAISLPNSFTLFVWLSVNEESPLFFNFYKRSCCLASDILFGLGTCGESIENWLGKISESRNQMYFLLSY